MKTQSTQKEKKQMSVEKRSRAKYFWFVTLTEDEENCRQVSSLKVKENDLKKILPSYLPDDAIDALRSGRIIRYESEDVEIRAHAYSALIPYNSGKINVDFWHDEDALSFDNDDFEGEEEEKSSSEAEIMDAEDIGSEDTEDEDYKRIEYRDNDDTDTADSEDEEMAEEEYESDSDMLSISLDSI